jgi:hypothetical protein
MREMHRARLTALLTRHACSCTRAGPLASRRPWGTKLAQVQESRRSRCSGVACRFGVCIASRVAVTRIARLLCLGVVTWRCFGWRTRRRVHTLLHGFGSHRRPRTLCSLHLACSPLGPLVVQLVRRRAPAAHGASVDVSRGHSASSIRCSPFSAGVNTHTQAHSLSSCFVAPSLLAATRPEAPRCSTTARRATCVSRPHVGDVGDVHHEPLLRRRLSTALRHRAGPVPPPRQHRDRQAGPCIER